MQHHGAPSPKRSKVYSPIAGVHGLNLGKLTKAMREAKAKLNTVARPLLEIILSRVAVESCVYECVLIGRGNHLPGPGQESTWTGVAKDDSQGANLISRNLGGLAAVEYATSQVP